MKYTLFKYIAAVAAVVCGLSSCNSDAKEEAESAVAKGLRIGVTPTFDCLPLVVAERTGVLKAVGLEVNIQTFKSHLDIDTALAGGSIAAGFSENIRIKRLQELPAKRGGVKDPNISLVAMQHDNLDWLLIANIKQRIVKVEQLKDHIVGVTRHSATELLGQTLLDSAKLSDQQAFMIPINDISLRMSMLMSAEIDAAWLPQPQASQAKYLGHKVLASSRASRNDTYGVFVVRTLNAKVKNNKALTLSQEQTEKLRKAYNMGCDSLNKRGIEHYETLIKQTYGITDKEFKALGKHRFRHL